MKKRIAMVLTLMLATGTFTACTAEEKVNDTNKTSVVSTAAADVSSSAESSEPLPTEFITEITTTEKATVSQNTELTETDTQSEEKADSGQNSAQKCRLNRRWKRKRILKAV